MYLREIVADMLSPSRLSSRHQKITARQTVAGGCKTNLQAVNVDHKAGISMKWRNPQSGVRGSTGRYFYRVLRRQMVQWIKCCGATLTKCIDRNDFSQAPN
jgi:hypothetical protein